MSSNDMSEDIPHPDSASSPNTDSSDSDEEMEQEEDEFLRKLEAINMKLVDQPGSYDLLLEKIQTLQALGDLKELRNARATLSNLYPLTPDLWLSWIQDESTLVTDVSGKKDIIQLFERATKDYHSVKLWVEYIQYMKDIAAEDNRAECRLVMERAIAAMGLHVSEGQLIWDVYREWELKLLSEDRTEEQTARCSVLCFRELAVPLVGMEKAYERIKRLFPIDESAERNYKNALQKLKVLEEWESKLVAGNNSVAAYQEYIGHEKQEKSNPSRIVCLYERALCDNALDRTLWLDYIRYASNELQSGPVALELSERALRNLPWDTQIWIQSLHDIEKFTGDADKVRESFERGLVCCTSGPQAGSLWLKYIEFLRRKIDFKNISEADVTIFMKTLIAAEEHLRLLSPEPKDYIAEILLYGIRIQAHTSNSMKTARKLWYQAIRKGYGHEFKLWIQFYQLEQRYGDINASRKCLEKAMSAMADSIDVVAELWLNFERDFGDLKSIKHAEEKITEFMQMKYEADQVETDDVGNKRKRKFQKGNGKTLSGRDRGKKKKKLSNPDIRKGSGESVGDIKNKNGEAPEYQKSSPIKKLHPTESTLRRPQKSFVPRSLQMQHPSTSKTLNPKPQTEPTVQTASGSEIFKKPMSNADFRNLLKKS